MQVRYPSTADYRFDLYYMESTSRCAGRRRRFFKSGAGVTRTGAPRLKENAPPQDPTVGLCLGPCGGPRGVSALSVAELLVRNR